MLNWGLEVEYWRCDATVPLLYNWTFTDQTHQTCRNRVICLDILFQHKFISTGMDNKLVSFLFDYFTVCFMPRIDERQRPTLAAIKHYSNLFKLFQNSYILKITVQIYIRQIFEQFPAPGWGGMNLSRSIRVHAPMLNKPLTKRSEIPFLIVSTYFYV
jgi:hypothetical protein